MFKRISVWTLLLCLLTSTVARATDWPVVRSVEEVFELSWGDKLNEVNFPIPNLAGDVVYFFWCRGGRTEQMDAFETRFGIPMVGGLMCRLSEGDKLADFTLLAEDDSAPWHTRGQIFERELVGKCVEYPEYGATRNFRLRDMTLTIDMSNIRIENDAGFRSMTMRISARPTPGVTSSYAERPDYLRPEENCEVVRKGVEPRMCRDYDDPMASGSWKECRLLTKPR